MEIADWLGSLRHRAALFIGVVVGCLVLGALLAVFQTPVYNASAEVVLDQPTGVTLLGGNEQNPDLAAELKSARSDDVEEKAAPKVADDAEVTVSVDDTTGILTFEASASSAEEAAAAANATANAYVEVRRDRVEAQTQAAIKELRKKATDLDDDVAAITGTDTASTERRSTLRSQQSAYRSAADQLEVGSIVGGTSIARVIDPAEAPDEQTSPVLVNYLLYALLAGLVLGAGTVGVAEFLDRSVKSPDAARAAAGGIPVLGQVRHPHRRFGSRAAPDAEGATGVVLIDAPASAGAEALRSLRLTIQSRLDERQPVIQVTSVAHDDGAARVAANLATAFARTGVPTVLVGLVEPADVKLPVGSARHKPLSALLEGKATAKACVVPVQGVENLTVISRSGDDEVELRPGPIGEVITQLESVAQVVILLSPPVLTSAAALELAHVVNGTVLVVRERATTADSLDEASRALTLMDSPVLGIVVTD